MMNKEDLSVFDEAQCEEFYFEDRYGMSRPSDDSDEDRWKDFGVKESVE